MSYCLVLTPEKRDNAKCLNCGHTLEDDAVPKKIMLTRIIDKKGSLTTYWQVPVYIPFCNDCGKRFVVEERCELISKILCPISAAFFVGGLFKWELLLLIIVGSIFLSSLITFIYIRRRRRVDFIDSKEFNVAERCRFSVERFTSYSFSKKDPYKVTLKELFDEFAKIGYILVRDKNLTPVDYNDPGVYSAVVSSLTEEEDADGGYD